MGAQTDFNSVQHAIFATLFFLLVSSLESPTSEGYGLRREAFWGSASRNGIPQVRYVTQGTRMATTTLWTFIPNRARKYCAVQKYAAKAAKMNREEARRACEQSLRAELASLVHPARFERERVRANLVRSHLVQSPEREKPTTESGTAAGPAAMRAMVPPHRRPSLPLLRSPATFFNV